LNPILIIAGLLGNLIEPCTTLTSESIPEYLDHISMSPEGEWAAVKIEKQSYVGKSPVGTQKYEIVSQWIYRVQIKETGGNAQLLYLNEKLDMYKA